MSAIVYSLGLRPPSTEAAPNKSSSIVEVEEGFLIYINRPVSFINLGFMECVFKITL